MDLRRFNELDNSKEVKVEGEQVHAAAQDWQKKCHE